MAVANELLNFFRGAATLSQRMHHIKLIELFLPRHQDTMSPALFTPQLLIVQLLFEMIIKLVELVNKPLPGDHVLALGECLTAHQNILRDAVQESELLPASLDL
jgi:hypothetical protein